ISSLHLISIKKDVGLGYTLILLLIALVSGKRIFFRHLDHAVAGEQYHDHKKYNINRGRRSRDQACSKKAGKQDHYKNPISQKSCSQCALIHFLQIFQLLYTYIVKYAIHRFLVFPRLLSSAAIFVFLSASAWTWIVASDLLPFDNRTGLLLLHV